MKCLGRSFRNGDGKKFWSNSSLNDAGPVFVAFVRFAVRDSSGRAPFL